MNTPTASDARRLQEIKDEMKELLDEARRIVRGTSEDARAKAYWYGHIACALDSDHSFLGGNSCTMQETCDRLSGQVDEDEEEFEDEDCE